MCILHSPLQRSYLVVKNLKTNNFNARMLIKWGFLLTSQWADDILIFEKLVYKKYDFQVDTSQGIYHNIHHRHALLQPTPSRPSEADRMRAREATSLQALAENGYSEAAINTALDIFRHRNGENLSIYILKYPTRKKIIPGIFFCLTLFDYMCVLPLFLK